jgi:hypothetical protein
VTPKNIYLKMKKMKSWSEVCHCSSAESLKSCKIFWGIKLYPISVISNAKSFYMRYISSNDMTWPLAENFLIYWEEKKLKENFNVIQLIKFKKSANQSVLLLQKRFRIEHGALYCSANQKILKLGKDKSKRFVKIRFYVIHCLLSCISKRKR